MKNKGFVIVFGIIGLFSILTMRENYRHNSSVPEFNLLSAFTHEGLQVSYKTLSSDESKQYLSRDLIENGYQPIHVTIQNNTSNTYQIAPSSVNMPTASGKEVANKITKSALPRAIAFRIASFFFWPLMIPSTIDSIKTHATHKSLKRDFSAKSIKEETILPYSTVHRLLYIPLEEYKEHFTFTLIDKNSGDSAWFETTS